ncbi:MAG: hypothetical protein AB1679_34035 [Actinomycetota bacterium]|jgi:hypothetical protein
MFRRAFAVTLVAGLLIVGAAPSPASAGDRHGRHGRHGYDKSYRHGYHKGYKHGYRHGYRDDRYHHGRYRRHHYYRYYYGPRYYYGHPYHYGHRYHYGPRDCWYGPAPANVVVVRCYAFAPHHLYLPVGAVAVWSFEDYGVPHTVTADDGSIDSGPRRGGQFRLRFDHPGEFRYHCALHPYMRGTVIVR